jgi:long-chain-fatty-acid--CoA ligase ACSBG
LTKYQQATKLKILHHRQTPGSGLKKKLLTWAKGKAAAHWASQEYGSTTKSPAFMFLARKLLHKAHVALGFDRCYAFYVAAAPIEKKILTYFASLDLPIMEIFGQSECTGPHTVNKYSAFKLGTVGRPMPGTETKTEEENGELCYRGRHIFAGYMSMPDKTKETIDPDGWLHSGVRLIANACSGMPSICTISHTLFHGMTLFLGCGQDR